MSKRNSLNPRRWLAGCFRLSINPAAHISSRLSDLLNKVPENFYVTSV